MFSSLSDRQIGLLAAVSTATCWSFLAILLKIALKYSDSYTIVWYRMAVSFAVLSLWLYKKHSSKVFVVLKQPPGLLLVTALALAFNYVGFMEGVNYTSPANAQIFIQTGPLLLAVSGIVFFRERLSKIQMTGFLFCILGFGLFFVDRRTLDVQYEYFWQGTLWIFAAAITWAVFASLQKKLTRFWMSHQINIYIYLVSAILFLPMVDWKTLMELPIAVHGLYFFLGLNTLWAYGGLSVALSKLPATQVSPILTMNPLLTLVLLFIIESLEWNIIPPDPVQWMGYLGALFAVSGVILVVRRPQKAKQPLKPA
ncbi:MAG: DMT family transporter [Bdellovibrionales bacterium]|nr:DMT family transporter [Bdellovibrionales bacterium]NQZ18607.1 DMT family transporter [Bdellovibrionales bacterium]